MNASERPRVWADVSALMALCAGMRLGFVWLVPRTLDSADAVAYLETARLFAAGEIASADPKIPILYPAFIALAHQVIPDIESAGRAVSWIFSTLLVVPVYLLARELHGRAVARVAGVLVACWPWLIDYGSRVATEPLAAFLFLAGISALLNGCRSEGTVSFAVAGAFFGLLHLARPEGTFIYLGAPLALLIFGRTRIEQPLRKLAAYALPGVAALALGVTSTYVTAGVWAVNYRMGFIGEQPEGSTVLRDFARTLVGMSADVPAVMLGPLLWAFFGAGIVVAGVRQRDARSELTVLYFALLQWLVVLPVLSPAPRYLMVTFVICSIWSARGIDRSAAALVRMGSGRWAHLPLGLVLGWMLFHASVQIASERFGDENRPVQPWEYKLAGEWMRDHLEPGPILTRKPQLGFYAGMPTVGPPAAATLDEILTMGYAEFRYLVIDERYTADLVPALKPLLDPAKAPEGIRLISADVSPYPAARIVIYEFVP